MPRYNEGIYTGSQSHQLSSPNCLTMLAFLNIRSFGEVFIVSALFLMKALAVDFENPISV